MPVFGGCNTDSIDVFTPDDIAEVVVDIHLRAATPLLVVVGQHTVLSSQAPGRVDITDSKNLNIPKVNQRRQMVVISHLASANHPDSDTVTWRGVAPTPKHGCMYDGRKAGNDSGRPCEKTLTGYRCVGIGH